MEKKPTVSMITRKDFLRDTAFIAASLTFLPKTLFAQGVTEEKGFDYIIVGAGASGVIVAQRLVEAGKKVLLIEAGGPTSKAVGGKDFPEYIKDGSRTIFDIPGEYGNIAWLAKGDKYKIKEAGFTYQGMGYGGNSQFNGMLFQMAPAFDFDKNWPTGWKSGDIRPYGERILGKMHVTNKPSVDGKHYLSEAADAVHAAYKTTVSSKRIPASSVASVIATTVILMSFPKTVPVAVRSKPILKASWARTANRRFRTSRFSVSAKSTRSSSMTLRRIKPSA